MALRIDSRMPGTERRCIVSWIAAQSSAETKTADDFFPAMSTGSWDSVA